MKYSCLFLILFSLSCSESELRTVQLFGVNIIGKWQLEATKISPGGPVDWSDVTDGPIIEFKPNGLAEVSNSENEQIGIYKIEEDGISIRFSETNNYRGSIQEGKLILGFIGCIEECSFRYRRIN